MDTITIIAVAFLVAIALLLILSPLWQHTHSAALLQDNHNNGESIEGYSARYQAILASIKELQFDYSMGKVSDEDYEPLLNEAKLEAARVRQQMDRLARSDSVSMSAALDTEIETLIAQARNGSAPYDEDLLDEVDAEIEHLKAGQPEVQHQTIRDESSATCIHCGYSLHPEASFCSHCGQPVAETCPQCNYAYHPDDAFCARCGAALQADVNNPTIEKSKI